MALEIYGIGIASALVSAASTAVVRRLAVSLNVLDIPNERSSHKIATPRGGGVAVVLTASVGFLALAWVGGLRIELLLALLVGGLSVAVAGLVDDRHPLRPSSRLAVHAIAAIWSVFWVGGVHALLIGSHLVLLDRVGTLLAVLGIVWTLNLFNFMDGIDGIAGSQAVFVACGGAVLTLIGGGPAEIAGAGFVFASACLGFLFWNWPPARIFMGDVGSGYMGYVLGVLALGAVRSDPSALWVWLILGAVFFVDATVTLVRRLLRGERIYEAHRSHAYQWLARRWGSHKRVTTAVLVLNVVWLFPGALFATLYPNRAMWISAVALVPVIVMAIASGAGRREIRVS